MYDKNNNKTKEIIKDKNGKVLKETNYTYDILDRVVEIKEIYELENITKTTKLVYDKNGNITEIHTS
ncbi:MAG: hypothetical protein LBF15_04610 [Candidatus Peribacteria bacterium]|nr:hypothetical protein [Candidatus Peribacteria bacterium]